MAAADVMLVLALATGLMLAGCTSDEETTSSTTGDTAGHESTTESTEAGRRQRHLHLRAGADPRGSIRRS